eukprot:1555135-Alexandrium_andersonii.AAC.1
MALCLPRLRRRDRRRCAPAWRGLGSRRSRQVPRVWRRPIAVGAARITARGARASWQAEARKAA